MMTPRSYATNKAQSPAHRAGRVTRYISPLNHRKRYKTVQKTKIISLPDRNSETPWQAEFRPVRRVEARNATFGYARISDDDVELEVACCLFDNGEVLTTNNWQGSIDVADEEAVVQAIWMDPETFQRAILLDGVPGILG